MSEHAAPYTLAEEVANAVSHGLGALASVAALTLLVTLSALENNLTRMVSFSIYGSSLILLFMASTLYHAMHHPFTSPKLDQIELIEVLMQEFILTVFHFNMEN